MSEATRRMMGVGEEEEEEEEEKRRVVVRWGRDGRKEVERKAAVAAVECVGLVKRKRRVEQLMTVIKGKGDRRIPSLFLALCRIRCREGRGGCPACVNEWGRVRGAL